MKKKIVTNILTGHNSAFCMVPWTHTYLSPQSERRLCCASREQASFTEQYLDSDNFNGTKDQNYAPSSLDDHWNSSQLRKTRLQMLAGDRPAECVVCQNQELSLSTYQDYFTKDLYVNLIEQAVLSTNTDGSTTMKPRSFDYRLSNQCNFKCRMCGDQLSSSWEQETRANLEHPLAPNHWMHSDLQKQMSEFQSNTAQVEFKTALERGEIDEIYWVGGEPLTWKFHWDMLNLAIKNGHAPQIFCRYNTNLSITSYNSQELFEDLLPQFKGYLIAASIDAPGEIGEYIRSGLNWEKWIENVRKVKASMDTSKNQNMYFDLTLTLPGMFALKEMVDIAQELDIEIFPKLVYAFDSTITISPLALPRHLLDPFIDDLIAYLFPRLSKNSIQLFSLLKNLKKRATHQEKYPDDYEAGFAQGRQYQKKLENLRDHPLTLDKIYAARPEILKWWQVEQ